MLEYFSKLVQPLKPTKLARNLAAGARRRSHLPSAFTQARNTNRRAGLINGETGQKGERDLPQLPKGLSLLCFAAEYLWGLRRGFTSSAAQQGTAVSEVQELWFAASALLFCSRHFAQ